jgi:hypothetical protein
MLAPNQRSLYTEILAPPAGMVLDRALATTYSVDPLTLLAVPVHMAFASARDNEPWSDGIAALDAVRRVAGRITVYSQLGLMQVPQREHVLFGMLESLIVEVKVSHPTGVFHPKLWVLKFKDPTGSVEPVMRLAVLSRNLTRDRCWDLSLRLEGQIGDEPIDGNEQLANLITRLPTLSYRTMSPDRAEDAELLGADVRRVRWQLPAGFDEVRFHVHGLGSKRWRPRSSDRLAVISPFCTDQALRDLIDTTQSAAILLSRPESLSELSPDVLAYFEACYVLDEAAETEEDETADVHNPRDTFGLHAKAYILEKNSRTHVVMGSANATTAGLKGQNVEVLVELIGGRRQVGGIDELLGNDGLGEVLAGFRPEDRTEIDSEKRTAEKRLEQARSLLAHADMHLRCARTDDGERWRLTLHNETVMPFPYRIESCHVWPITVSKKQWVDFGPLLDRRKLELGDFASASVTGLIAFELQSDHPDVRERFTLNLPVEGLPEERDRAILRTVIRNRDGFLRYLLLLLGDSNPSALAVLNGKGIGNGQWSGNAFDTLPLLEEMTRAYCREPERLAEIARLIGHLHEDAGEEGDVVPGDFLELWHVFENALKNRDA